MHNKQINRILIAGGSGTVGKKLTFALLRLGFEVAWLSRKPASKQDPVKTFLWNPSKQTIDNQGIKFADVVINLAGSGIADAKWTLQYKNEIYESRIQSTKLIYKALSESEHQVHTYLAASAIGIYGYNTPLNTPENGTTADNFLAKVCKDWEAAASPITNLGIRTAFLRIGVVLAEEGGFVKEVSAPIKNYIGAPLGNGLQHTSWIHIDDLCRLFIHIMQHEQLSGAYNAVSPNPETNAGLTKIMAKLLKKPLLLPPVPKFMLRLIFGELSDVLVASQHISAQKALESGFTFQFPYAKDALKDLIGE